MSEPHASSMSFILYTDVQRCIYQHLYRSSLVAFGEFTGGDLLEDPGICQCDGESGTYHQLRMEFMSWMFVAEVSWPGHVQVNH